MIENENSSVSPSPIRLQAVIADDRRSIALRFTRGGAVAWVTTTDTESVDALIKALGDSRGQMLEPVSANPPEGIGPLSAYDPRWCVLPDTANRFATFWIRHPGLGWSGYGFPRNEAANISKWLRKIPGIATTQDKLDSLPSSATSFGDDSFLITTAGLGFYYYGKGERRIGPNPFEQVEYDSDRAAGIVAGAIVEQRLEEVLKSRMRSDQPTITQNLFRPSGALGPFSIKIDIAYLLGLLSDEAFKDLTAVKNIRNAFAHDLELHSFDAQSIKDRCKNLVLVERHVGPVPQPPTSSDAMQSPPHDANPYMGLPDHEQKLAEPRFRYMMTAQIISYRLGAAAEAPSAPLPLV